MQSRIVKLLLILLVAFLFATGLWSLTVPSLVPGIFGQFTAYVALSFGVLFFLFAARYYVAIATVLFTPGANGNGFRNGNHNAGNMNSLQTNGNGINGFLRLILDTQ